MDLSLQHASAAPVQGKSVDCAADTVVRNIRAISALASPTVGDNIPTERALCQTCDSSRSTLRAARRIPRARDRSEVRPRIGAIITENRRTPAPGPAIQTRCGAI